MPSGLIPTFTSQWKSRQRHRRRRGPNESRDKDSPSTKCTNSLLGRRMSGQSILLILVVHLLLIIDFYYSEFSLTFIIDLDFFAIICINEKHCYIKLNTGEIRLDNKNSNEVTKKLTEQSFLPRNVRNVRLMS